MFKNMIKKNRFAFTLVEVLAIIVVLAIIALISIPNISNYIRKSKDQSFRTSIDSLIRAYEYEIINHGNIGRINPCSLSVNHCDYEGYIEKDENGNIAIYLDTGDKCVIGVAGSYEIKNGDCTKENEMPPMISEISISNLSVSSATILVHFIEEDLVTSIKFRLKDENDNVVYDWVNADSLDNSNNVRVGKKIYKNLESGKTYIVEVEIKNNALNNNTSTLSRSFTVLNYSSPEITYKKEWEKEKTVTITYDNITGISNKYRTKTNNLFDITGWIDTSSTTQNLTINNYHYYVEAKSQIGDSVLAASSQIGYIDNENDINNPKPSVEVIEYKNNGINTKEVSLRLKDTLSGVGSYCVTTTNNINNCDGIGTGNELSKWIVVSNIPEIKEETIHYTLSQGGTYYVFLKDYVGNVSDSKSFTTYDVHYDLNGGSGLVLDQIKLKDYTLTLSNQNPTRTGYTFKGWSLSNNGPVAYNSGSDYTSNNSINLYAGWKANELTFNNQSFTKTFDTSAQTINIVGASNGNGNYTYSEVSESNGTTSTNYITISNDGTITLAGSTPVGVYTYVVKATSQVNNNVDSYTEVTKEATMTITVNPYNLSTSSISNIASVNYNGTEQKPTPDVIALGITLSSTNDFTYSYANNINAGTATVTVTGKGNYTGQNSKTFTINRVSATSNTVTCATLTYNGTNQSLISTTNISNGTVYYKIGTELTSSNYTTGSTTKPTAKDAGSYVVYYYAPADNYTETKGSVTCSIAAKSIAVSWSNTSFSYNGSSHVPTATASTGVTNETMTLSVSGAQTNAGSYTATATCSSITTNNKCANYTLTNTSTSFSIAKINPTMNLSATSGTLKIGTNGTITVTGSNYGTLSCSSSNTTYATCSVSGTTVTIVPKAVGSATITVTGAGGTNYNSISKTYAATIQLGYRCTEGTLTADSTKGASSGGYICVKNASSQTSGGRCLGLSCSSYVYDHSFCSNTALNSCNTVDCYSSSCGGYGTYCNIDGSTGSCTVSVSYGQNCTCTGGYSEGTTTYYCPSGWSTYSGSGSSLKCYKAATL